MGLITNLSAQNFMCFRERISFDFQKATYLIGTNNAGKTAVLLALRCFFDDEIFLDEALLNKTEFLAKGPGANKCSISISFDLEEVQTRLFKQRLIKEYGNQLHIKKIFIYRIITKQISIEYEINGKKSPSLELPDDLKKLIKSVRITYLHPQEGKELLKRAQEKLKDRLLLNWGRKGRVTDSLEELKKAWDDLKKQADVYLSRSLTQSLQNIWPGSNAKINLPKNIASIIAISDIAFQGQKAMPEIQLTAQGTGAQSLVLYLTHYLLDSDRSLHKGEYHPLWLLEEPESFLYADLIFKLGQQLNSDWLDNIQMVISTHSPMILASSRLSKERVYWNLLNNHKLDKGKALTGWSEEEIKTIGKYMGDSNFYIYFLANSNEDLFFIEDRKPITIKAWKDNGINVGKGLEGVGEITKYINALEQIGHILTSNVYFIVDSDRAIGDFSRYTQKLVDQKDGFKKYKIDDRLYLLVLPEGNAVEGLYNEFDNFLQECISKLVKLNNEKYELSAHIPGSLSRTYDVLRKDLPEDMEAIKNRIKNTQDIKDNFWKKINNDGLKMCPNKITSLKSIIS